MSGRHRHGHEGIEEVAAGTTVVHRLDPRVKIIGLIGLAIVSATTPVGRWAAFAGYLSMLLALVGLARLPLSYLARRMVVELPFLLAAGVLVLTAPDGPQVGYTVAAKATIGVLAMVVLSSTTPFPALLHGFDALRTPRTITLTVGLLWRYLHVFGGEFQRMRRAREVRGYQPRWLWQAGAIAATIGTMFVRTYERGERVHQAMLARGYDGTMPATLRTPVVLHATDAVFVCGLALLILAVRIFV